MLTLISVYGSAMFEAVIVHRTRNRMRVIAPGFSDALELRRRQQSWFMDSGEPVQFEFLAGKSSSERAVVQSALVARIA